MRKRENLPARGRGEVIHANLEGSNGQQERREGPVRRAGPRDRPWCAIAYVRRISPRVTGRAPPVSETADRADDVAWQVPRESRALTIQLVQNPLRYVQERSGSGGFAGDRTKPARPPSRPWCPTGKGATICGVQEGGEIWPRGACGDSKQPSLALP